jgi:chromosome segregation ATPase
MQEFVDQKKEMFHAELAYTNVQSEIKNLKDNEIER